MGALPIARAPDLPRPAPGAILHIRAPNLPQFRFEWHPGRRRVYLVRHVDGHDVGEPIAFEIDTHGGAVNAVLIWTRGYRTREREDALGRDHRRRDGSPAQQRAPLLIAKE